MPASPIRKLAPLADRGEVARHARLSPQHRAAGHRDAGLHARPPQAARCASAGVLAVRPARRSSSRSLQQLLRAARSACTLDHDQILATTGGSEAILFALHGLRERGRRYHGRRAVLRELPRLRDDGRTQHRAGDEPRPRRLPSAAARGLRARAHAAHAHGHPLQSRTIRPARSTRARSWRWSPSSAATHGLFLISRRGLSRVRLRRTQGDQRARAPERAKTS